MDWKKFGCFISSFLFFLLSVIFVVILLIKDGVIGKGFFPYNPSRPKKTQTTVYPDTPQQDSSVDSKPISNNLRIMFDAGRYHNDADFKNDSIFISFRFYDPYAQPNSYSINNIPIRIELFGFSDVLDVNDLNIEGEEVFERTYLVSNETIIGDFYGIDIRIPFQEINSDRQKHYQYGRLVYSFVQGGEITYRNYYNNIQLYE